MKRTKRLLSVLLGILMVACLAGWAKKEVDLLNETPPLIDLDAAIREADFGNNGNTGGETGDPLVEDPNGKGGQNETDGQKKAITITIRDEEIRYGNGKEMFPIRSVDTLKRKIQQEYQKGVDIFLTDDYAEAHRYREVRAMLEEAGYPFKEK